MRHWHDLVSFLICANSNLRLALNHLGPKVSYPLPLIFYYADTIASYFVFLSHLFGRCLSLLYMSRPQLCGQLQSFNNILNPKYGKVVRQVIRYDTEGPYHNQDYLCWKCFK